MHQPMENYRKKLEKGEVVIGACISMGDRSVCEIMGYAGCDFLWIDTEHSMSDRQEVFGHIMACRASNTAAFVRVPWNDPVLVKPILDMGADGIIFPNIRSREEAELAVASVRYPLKGVRGYGPARANLYGMMPRSEYLQWCDGIYTMVQIEHVDAVSQIEEICQVDGVDCIMFGAMDLSASLGQLGRHDTPEFIQAVDTVVEAAKKYHKTIGCCVGSAPETIRFWLDRGIKVYAGGMDSSMLGTATRTMVGDIRAYAETIQEGELK